MPTPHHSSDQQEPLSSAPSSVANAASAQMAVFSADLQGEFRACNAAFSKLFGYSSQELMPDGAIGARFYAPDEAEAELRERLEQIRRARSRE